MTLRATTTRERFDSAHATTHCRSAAATVRVANRVNIFVVSRRNRTNSAVDAAQRQGLTLVHLSAQPEPFLTQIHPEYPLILLHTP
jgi:hypothetical protein